MNVLVENSRKRLDTFDNRFQRSPLRACTFVQKGAQEGVPPQGGKRKKILEVSIGGEGGERKRWFYV